MADSDLNARVSKPKLSSGAAPEDVGLADVAAGHLSAGMAELGLDGALVAIVHRDRGGVTAAQAVAGVTGGVKPCGFGGTLDDQGHRAVGQAVQPNGAGPTDRAEQRAVDDAGVVEPGPDRGYRAGVGMDAEGHADRAALALLVGLGAGEPDPDALVAELDPAVAGRIARRLARPGVETDQLGAAQRRGEAEQQQGAVAPAGGGVGQSGEHGQDVGADRRSFRCFRGADHAADAAPDLADGGVSGVEGMPGDPVGLADGGEAALQGGRLVAGLGQLGQVEAEGFRRRRQGRQAVASQKAAKWSQSAL